MEDDGYGSKRRNSYGWFEGRDFQVITVKVIEMFVGMNFDRVSDVGVTVVGILG